MSTPSVKSPSQATEIPTPRTDEYCQEYFMQYGTRGSVHAHRARELERELVQAVSALKELMAHIERGDWLSEERLSAVRAVIAKAK